MSFILIDRRKAGKGKSTNNRQKLIKRIKSFIKQSIPQNIGQGGVSGGTNTSSSPVTVAGSALEEPFFTYAQGGEMTRVFIGNPEYDRGDELDVQHEEESGGAGQGGGGEDDFVVNIARDEFLELFFEDCELPNLDHEKLTDKLENKYRQAGFSTTGNPAQLSVIRSFKQSMARRWALMAPHKEEIAELEVELRMLEEGAGGSEYLGEEARIARMGEIILRLEQLGVKIAALNGFDKVDLRYKKKESQPLMTIESVLIMIMDISGSMGQEEKTIARRWFALLYAFIKRRYGNTDLVFIAHTDEAFELSEADFFSTRINGGTSVSPAIAMANKIIKERFDPSQTNIYVSHASDGDNWGSDNENVVEEMTAASGLMNKIQLFSYIEVGSPNQYSWYGSSTANTPDTNLWEAYEACRGIIKTEEKLNLARIQSPDECYAMFKKVFKKRVRS